MVAHALFDSGVLRHDFQGAVASPGIGHRKNPVGVFCPVPFRHPLQSVPAKRHVKRFVRFLHGIYMDGQPERGILYVAPSQYGYFTAPKPGVATEHESPLYVRCSCFCRNQCLQFICSQEIPAVFGPLQPYTRFNGMVRVVFDDPITHGLVKHCVQLALVHVKSAFA